jgi:hypothetical protein
MENNSMSTAAMRILTEAIPIGEISNFVKDSCSGSFLRMSAVIGSGWTPCRSPAMLCDRIIAEDRALDSPFSV